MNVSVIKELLLASEQRPCQTVYRCTVVVAAAIDCWHAGGVRQHGLQPLPCALIEPLRSAELCKTDNTSWSLAASTAVLQVVA